MSGGEEGRPAPRRLDPRASRRLATVHLATALLVTALASCHAARRPELAAPPRGGPPVPWDAMLPDQKEAYMREAVMPVMRTLFARHDPHRYTNMGCTPCHARGRPGYKMPNEDLLLDPASCAEVPGADPRMAAESKFMDEEVGPAMARLLGKPWNSCFLCHEYDGAS